MLLLSASDDSPRRLKSYISQMVFPVL